MWTAYSARDILSILFLVLQRICQKLGKWHDVLTNARSFQRSHVGCAIVDLDHRPWMTGCSQHNIHQEPSRTSVSVKERVDES